MDTQRTHYVTTSDGVTIGGTVHGKGPPERPIHLLSAEPARPRTQQSSP